MRLTSALSAATAGMAVLLTTACGALPGEGGLLGRHSEFLDQDALSIAKDSFADMRTVTSVRMLGDVETDEFGMADIDLRLDGTDCQGSFDTDDGEVRFVQVGKSTWFSLDDDMWTSRTTSDRQAELVLDKYSGAWFAGDKKDLAQLCDIEKFLSNFEVDQDDKGGDVGVGDVEEVGDIDAVMLSGRDGKKLCKIWVAVDAPHYVVKMTQRKRGDATQVIYFEEFGVEVDIVAPDKKDVMALP